MKKASKSRILSLLLVVAMVFSMLPVSAFAADGTATYTKVTSAEELTTGQYVLVTETGYAPGELDGTWVTAVQPVVTEDGTIVNPTEGIWTLTVTDAGVVLTDANGTSIAPAGGNNNGIQSGEYKWAAEFADGTFTFSGTGEDTVKLASNVSSGQNRFRAYKVATIDKYQATYPCAFTLYKLSGEAQVERKSGIVTDLTTLRDGDKVVVFNPTYGKALSTVYSGFYNTGADVTLADGVLAGYTDTELWTVGIREDGTYTFSTSEGGKLSMGSKYGSMPLDDSYDAWEMIAVDNAEGFFYIDNVGRKAVEGNFQYRIQWDTREGYATWSAYNGTTEPFQQQLYLVIEEEPPVVPTEPTEPSVPTDPSEPDPTEPEPSGSTYTLTDTLAAGDTVVMYNAASGTLLSSTASGYKLSGVTATVEADTITTDDTTVAWVVGLDDSGEYTFTQGNMVLGMVQSGSYVNLSTNASDGYTSWALEHSETNNVFYVLNTKMPATTYGFYYIEYYNGYTAYSTSSPSDSAYGISFYKLGSTEPAQQYGKLTAADQLVDGSYVMVVSTGYAPLEHDNGWLSIAQPVIENDQVTASQGAVWTLDVTGETVTFTDKNGVTIAPKGGNNNGLSTGSYDWDWSFDESSQTFRFKGTGSDTVTLASNPTTTGNYPGNHRFRGYKNSTVASQGYPADFTLYRVDPESVNDPVLPDAGLPTEGDQVMLYNQNAQAVLAAENDAQSIEKADATVTDGVITQVENGGVIFTVERNGDYYRFYNERYGYLCSNGTGNNAFYSKDFSEEGVSTDDADWLVRTCSGGVGGFELESRTAKFNGRYSQWLEYYSDSFKTYSMYNVSDYTIYSFYFYPVAEGFKTEQGVVNDPKVVFTSADTAMKGQDYTLTFYLDDINTIASSSIKVQDFNGNVFEIEATADGYSARIPASYLVGNSIVFLVEIEDDGRKFAYSGSLRVSIVDEPSIGAVTPAANSQTGENKRPVISAEIFNAGKDATNTMTVNGSTVDATYADGKLTYTPAEDMTDGRTSVVVTVKRADGKETSKTWSFTVGESRFQLYFGQLHSHTQYSDGSGTLDSALNYIENLPASANVQFVAFTDHSNYFDGSKTAAGTANPEGALYDMSLASTDSQKLWNAYHASVDAFNERNAGSMVALAGFEMTWSGGPGHINTFNTPGIVSRNNSTLNNKTSDAGMKAYYALLSQEEGIDSISQFNHPGTTFGNFTDFSYWDAVIDSRIHLVEVGNGEGQIGAGGYYPSYEQYIMALDKGWHVAPTNNQDNHKGKWGNANDARDVVLTDNFTEDGIYEAIRAMRVYATEDKNLQIGYTVNDLPLGSSITEVPEKLNFNVTVYDPDSADSISKVELVVNSGKVAYTWDDPAELTNGELTAQLDPTYSYYFVRVTEGDGDLAVTAPVWVGESLKLGISSVECGTATPVTDEEVTISTTLFNSESKDATIQSLTYTTNGDEVLGTDTTGYSIAASGTTTVEFKFTPTKAKSTTVTVTAVILLNGETYTFSTDITLDVQDSSSLVYLGIDASHYNEYVAGNYADSMGNFSNLAAEYGIRTVQLNTSEDLIAACSNEKFKALILTAPSRRLAAAQSALLTYTDDELAAIKAFNASGGAVILAGWSDHYEYYPDALTMTPEQHMAATQNTILEALGSSLRISDDATYDDVYSAIDGCDPYRLYFNTYNFDNFLTEGVEVGEGENAYNSLYTEKFSHYGGASIHTVDGTLPDTVSPVVYAHSSTYSKDTDNDGLGGSDIPKYPYAEGDDRLMVMASEQLEGQGLIIVSGAAFMSNFEVQATISDSGSEKNYSNYRICENLLTYLNPVTATAIAEVRAQTEAGYKFTVEGILTSNASGYDADTAFFDCSYVQDETAGINIFPVAGNFKIGDRVRVTGTTSSYQGEPQLSVTSIEVIGEGTVEPEQITAKELNDRSAEGKLVTIQGTVSSFELANGLVQTIMVQDETGEGRIFIDGYITTGKDVENLAVGCSITATGLASYDDTFNAPDGPFPRIRIRDRADIVCTTSPEHVHVFEQTVIAPTCTTKGYTLYQCTLCDYSYQSDETDVIPCPSKAFQDVADNAWYHEGLDYVISNGLMNGLPGKVFRPDEGTTRAMMAVILYRAAGSPSVEGMHVTFTDLTDDWYRNAVIWAANSKVVIGRNATTFDPDASITREEMILMLWRLAGKPAADESVLTTFQDVADVATYAKQAMAWAVGTDLVLGVGNGRLAPTAAASRAQVATIVTRYLKK